MKLARLFLAVLAVGTLAACGDTVTGPQAAPPATPLEDTTCTVENGTQVCRTGQGGSGG